MNNKYYGLANLRALENENKEMILEGYALKFNQPTQPKFKELYGYTEIVGERALDDTDLSDVPLKYNHSDEKVILARTRGGTLNLIKDSIGLRIRAILNNKIPDHVSVYEAVKSGLIDKMSFGFYPDEEKNSYDGENRTVTINKILALTDVSVVDVPAYDNTEVYARNLEQINNLDIKQKELELRKRKLKILLSL
jgi:HK97 family phage prohead protease|nr:MAG TPA: prohead serine protease [Caudoviricetes sp.]